MHVVQGVEHTQTLLGKSFEGRFLFHQIQILCIVKGETERRSSEILSGLSCIDRVSINNVDELTYAGVFKPDSRSRKQLASYFVPMKKAPGGNPIYDFPWKAVYASPSAFRTSAKPSISVRSRSSSNSSSCPGLSAF